MSRDATPLRPTAPDSGDELLQRYHEASALEAAHPSPALREAVLTQARAAAAAAGRARAQGEAPAHGEMNPELIAEYGHATLGNCQNGSKSSGLTPPGGRSAANDTSWRIRAVASVAVLGLATLLFLQLERGTPEEREMAMGQTPATAPATEPTRSTAPPVQAADPAQSATPALPVTPEAPVAGKSARDTQAAATPITPKGAPSDKARAEEGPSGIASTTDPGPRAEAAPTERAVAPAGSAGRDAAMAENAADPGTTGPGQTAGAMKSAPSRAPVRAAEPSLSASPSPVAPAATLAGPPAPQNLEARSRAMSTAAPAGRSADSGSPVLNGSASTASQRLLAAAGSGALEAARQALNDGAPVNALDAAGQTPLMLAVRHGDEAMVRLLLAAGADRTRTDAAGLTAADHARRAGQATLLPLLNATESTPPAPLR